MKKSIIAMVLSVAMMLTMFPTGVLADDFIENTEGVTVSAEGQSNDDQGEESDTAQVNVDEDEETQPDTEKPETDQAAPDQTETNQTEQPEPGSTVPDQAGTTPDAENFQVFLLEKDGLTVYFNPYQVAPWSEGVPSVGLTLRELTDARPKSAFWK